MRTIQSLFWNPVENRLRAFWRLVLQLLFLLAIGVPFAILFGLFAAAFLSATQSITPDQLSDPLFLQQVISSMPIFVLLSALVSFFAILGSVWLAGRLLDHRSLADFGFHINRSWWIDLAFGLFLGAFLMLAIFLVELAAGWVLMTGAFVTANSSTPFALAILGPLFSFIFVGIYEELISRGYQLTNLAEGLNGGSIGPRPAIILAWIASSLVFGIMHWMNPNASLVSTLNIFLAGIVLLGIGYVLTGELAIPIGVHITWNFFQGNVFGFPVSGVQFPSATFIAIRQGGPALLTGGAFGPEAGLIGLIAIFFGGLIIALWVRWRRGYVNLHLPIAEPPVQIVALSDMRRRELEQG
jgi:membrane protease YdiL (CAAX protease family)